jgi:predicted nucleic acid-binding protein
VILADASVWIDHLRARDDVLVKQLGAGNILVHPFVIGEIALSHLRQRDLVVRMLQRQRPAVVAAHNEVMQLIDVEKLFGLGIGYVDAHLLASARLTPGSSLWTRDKRLREISRKLGIGSMLV